MPLTNVFLHFLVIFHEIETGSRAEGFDLRDSDFDTMTVDNRVTVMYPDQRIPPNMACNAILYIREADCRPGYVNLQLGQMGCIDIRPSLVRRRNSTSTFVSSELYRENDVISTTTCTGMKHESNGPSCTLRRSNGYGVDSDDVQAFLCNSWPKKASEWITRTRLYGWPDQTSIDKIVNSGCHLVPVGDKCSADTRLQWRISFATAEKSLVHSFSHIQFKVYLLLKYFLKQIKKTLKETIGDDDILCSYFFKTILFHAIENSCQMLWQDKNLFYCFWFCFNILIAWVRVGFCPNYFIPTNNLFQRKIHGQHQQILMDILNNCCKMKWMCLSVGKFFKPSIWEDLCNTSIQAQLVCPQTAQKTVLKQDIVTLDLLVPAGHVNRSRIPTLRTFRKIFHSLSNSQSDFDEVYTYHYAIRNLEALAEMQICPDHTIATSNKTRYRRLRKYKHWMIPNALMGTDLLNLATFYFLTGNFSKPLEMCKQVTELASYYSQNIDSPLHPELVAVHRHEYSKSGHTFDRLRKMYTDAITPYEGGCYLPHLCLEFLREFSSIIIPPLPYSVFRSFLCCHELGDTRGRDAALQQLSEIQNDVKQGGRKYWIVHTFLGICYQTLGDNHRAIRAYWDSAQSKTMFHERNPAIKRIAIVYLCMYASQRSEKG